MRNSDRTKCHHRIACELRTYRRDTPQALTVVHGKANEIEAVERNLQVTPGQISDNEKPEPGRVFSPIQSPVWDLNSAKRRMSLPPGQTQSSEKRGSEPGFVFPPDQTPVWNLNSVERQVGLE